MISPLLLSVPELRSFNILLDRDQNELGEVNTRERYDAFHMQVLLDIFKHLSLNPSLCPQLEEIGALIVDPATMDSEVVRQLLAMTETRRGLKRVGLGNFSSEWWVPPPAPLTVSELGTITESNGVEVLIENLDRGEALLRYEDVDC